MDNVSRIGSTIWWRKVSQQEQRELVTRQKQEQSGRLSTRGSERYGSYRKEVRRNFDRSRLNHT